jgi:hypothetical protein
MDAEQDVAWMSLDAAAASLVEMTLAPEVPGTLHLAHPRPVSWSSIIDVFARELELPLVSYDEWLRRLEASVKDPVRSEVEHMRTNPALRLLPFFRSARAGPGLEAMGLPLLDTRLAQEAAPALRTVPSLGAADVQNWLRFWRSISVL